ncbi:MAG: WYL domain-containing protein [Paracoccaceae bacterium]|uniref:WYL domain-containing protein n=1 Tax=Salipiger profundus TaxID=1229727 RepID=UPI000DA10A30|nr:WYL domain-containing protein [Salipiger profundus]
MSQIVQVRPAMPIALEYQDADGVVTERQINLNAVELAENDHLYLHGFCQLRRENRTFRAGRIRSIAKKGGQPVDVVSFLRREHLVDLNTTHAPPSSAPGQFQEVYRRKEADARAAIEGSWVAGLVIILATLIIVFAVF